MLMSDTAPPSAGWYADPENPAGERWWNGSGWSDAQRPSTVAAPVPPVTTPVPPAAAAVPPAAAPFAAPAPVSADPRPDPYAAPPAAVPQPYYGAPGASPYVAPYGAPARGQGANGLAIAGLIVSSVGWLIVSVLGPVAGIILSAFGLAEAKKREAAGHPNPGRGVATAGLVVGIVVAVLGILIVAVYFVFLLNVGYPY
jgi:hypothetical protein